MPPRPGSVNWRRSWSGAGRADHSRPRSSPRKLWCRREGGASPTPALTRTPAARKRRVVEATVPERELHPGPSCSRPEARSPRPRRGHSRKKQTPSPQHLPGRAFTSLIRESEAIIGALPGGSTGQTQRRSPDKRTPQTSKTLTPLAPDSLGPERPSRTPPAIIP